MTSINRTLMFIFMELFTYRFYRDYSRQTMKDFRDVVSRCIQSYCVDSIPERSFVEYLRSNSLKLPYELYVCVKRFIKYLNYIDKIVKI